MTKAELADEIGGLIFETIKHGDEKHQAWLHDKSHTVAQQIITALRRSESDYVPEGETRWLIEGTSYYPTRRVFWTGRFWAHADMGEGTPALEAARYRSKHHAEAVIPTIKNLSTDSVHNITAEDHMFQCGISPERQPSSDQVLVPREPTGKQIVDMLEGWFGGPGGSISFEDRMKRAYRAMLTAAEAEGCHE